jgi:hypothetical protein
VTLATQMPEFGLLCCLMGAAGPSAVEVTVGNRQPRLKLLHQRIWCRITCSAAATGQELLVNILMCTLH